VTSTWRKALQEAFRAALEHWPRTGLPRNPRAWLVSTGRFKGIDVVRRRIRHNAALARIAKESRQSYLLQPFLGGLVKE
jgi:RNA polymerase sigma-70 factor (ECF subfamily)